MSEEIKAAIAAVKEARNHFENAEPDYIDESIYRLDAAETRLSMLINRQKKAA